MIPAQWSQELASDSPTQASTFASPAFQEGWNPESKALKLRLFVDWGPEHKDFWVVVKPASAFYLASGEHWAGNEPSQEASWGIDTVLLISGHTSQPIHSARLWPHSSLWGLWANYERPGINGGLPNRTGISVGICCLIYSTLKAHGKPACRVKAEGLGRLCMIRPQNSSCADHPQHLHTRASLPGKRHSHVCKQHK